MIDHKAYQEIPGIKHTNAGSLERVKNRIIREGDGNIICFFCSKPLKPYKGLRVLSWKLPQDKLTLDHVYSKLDLRRLLSTNKDIVPACPICNRNRGLEEMARVFKFESARSYHKDVILVDPKNKTIRIEYSVYNSLKFIKKEY